MPYVADPTNVAQPDGATVKASQAAPEFRALKTYIRDTILANLNLKALINNTVLTGTATIENAHVTGIATFDQSPIVPTKPIGTSDTSAASTAYVMAAAISAVLPGAASGAGLSISSDGTTVGYMYSVPDCLAVLSYLGA